jgi:hypothetical protein
MSSHGSILGISKAYREIKMVRKMTNPIAKKDVNFKESRLCRQLKGATMRNPINTQN